MYLRIVILVLPVTCLYGQYITSRDNSANYNRFGAQTNSLSNNYLNSITASTGSRYERRQNVPNIHIPLPNIHIPGTRLNDNSPNNRLPSSNRRQNYNLPVLNSTVSQQYVRNNQYRNQGPSSKIIDCGYRQQQTMYSSPSPNINEQNAGSGELPWMIALLLQTPANMKTKFFCGGSLIHPKVVVTAAHCINRKAKQNIKVRAGESNPNYSYGQFQIRNTQDIIRHEDYNELTAIDDIALIVVDQSFILNNFIRTICLPTRAMAIADELQCYSAGWDSNPHDENKKSEHILLKSQVHVLTANTCQNELRKTRLGLFFQLHASFKCASGTRGEDPCIGDGGSPLICPMERGGGSTNRFYQTGLVSWGIGCQNKNVPGVYVDVAVHRAWIDRQMNERQFGTKSYTASTF